MEIVHFTDYVWEVLDKFLTAGYSLIELVNPSVPKRAHHVIEPFKLGSLKRIDNVLIKKFGDIEYVLA